MVSVTAKINVERGPKEVGLWREYECLSKSGVWSGSPPTLGIFVFESCVRKREAEFLYVINAALFKTHYMN